MSTGKITFVHNATGKQVHCEPTETARIKIFSRSTLYTRMGEPTGEVVKEPVETAKEPAIPEYALTEDVSEASKPRLVEISTILGLRKSGTLEAMRDRITEAREAIAAKAEAEE